jgi:hypothetical protein
MKKLCHKNFQDFFFVFVPRYLMFRKQISCLMISRLIIVIKVENYAFISKQ